MRLASNPHYLQGGSLGGLTRSHIIERKRHIEKVPAPETVRAALSRPTVSPDEARRIVAEAKERGLL